MAATSLLPLVAFFCLMLLERTSARTPGLAYSRADQWLNIAGLAVQGALVPAAGYWIATQWLAVQWPQAAGALSLGWLGAFALNFVVVDFLYYWQHRLFHRVPFLWALHRCHHASRRVDVWASSRNSLAVNFLFVYLLANPVLGFLCDSPAGFFAGAALTASLDLWRHSRLRAPKFLGLALVTPAQHHAHHGLDGEGVNFGANLSVWDRWFGTARLAHEFPSTYGTAQAPSAWRQFFFPW